MLEQPLFMVTEPARIAAAIADVAWATLVTHTPARGLVVSHLPVVAEPDGESIVGHLARPDAGFHELGQHEVVLILEGPNGYLSPSWYGEIPHVPTWDFVVTHLHGRPEVTDDDETWDILRRTVDRMEGELPEPFDMLSVEQHARNIAPGVTGFRLAPSRIVCKAKLSQDESPELRRNAAAALRRPGPYRHDVLADRIEETMDGVSSDLPRLTADSSTREPTR
jgi:transcriptional regulator